jgi:hypothetical protein
MIICTITRNEILAKKNPQPEIPITSPFKKETKQTAETASSHRKYLNKINSNINCQGKS